MGELNTPEGRAEAFMAAWRAAEVQRGPRTEHEPRGLAGVPGPDGVYRELMPEDVEAVLAKARLTDFATLARYETPAGTVLLLQPSAAYSRQEQLQELGQWAEAVYPCTAAVLPDAVEVRIIDGGEPS